jgi:molybdate transport system regulatory protein
MTRAWNQKAIPRRQRPDNDPSDPTSGEDPEMMDPGGSLMKPVLNLRLRLYLGEEIAMGPGKADLLEAIRDTGSIAAAGRRMGMSYRRAWLLVDTMNRCFREPLVSTARGGARRGGAVLTPLGSEALARYRDLEAAALGAVTPGLTPLAALLADGSAR